MLGFTVVVRDRTFHVFSLFYNPKLDVRIYDRLLTSMAAVQADDVLASIFVGHLNGHHHDGCVL